MDIAARSYVIFFSCLIVLCEIDWRFVMKKIRLLDDWTFRGFFYAYVGLCTIDKSGDLDSPEDITGISLMVLGLVYAIMGLLCIKGVVQQRRKYAYREVDPDSVFESV